MVMEAVRAGHGISVLPRPIVSHEVDTGALTALLQETDSRVAYYILTRPDAMTPSLRVFRRWLLASAR